MATYGNNLVSVLSKYASLDKDIESATAALASAAARSIAKIEAMVWALLAPSMKTGGVQH